MSENNTAGAGNSGITVGGDLSMNDSAVAVNRSTATVHSAAPAERAAAVEELRAAARQLTEHLREHREAYEDGDDLVQTAELVEEELALEEPRRTRLLRWLASLAPAVAGSAAVTADVAAIQDSVAGLF
jgi:pyridoxine 5'-phosphate synthase PdxJ